MSHAVRDEGSAGIEAALAVTAVLLVTWFTIGALRVTTSSGDVGAAARAGARAAAAARAGAEAAAAEAVASQALADRGVACAGGPQVSVLPGATQVGSAEPVRTMTVTVVCTVALDDVAFGGFEGPRTVTGTATEMVDPIRGGRT